MLGVTLAAGVDWDLERAWNSSRGWRSQVFAKFLGNH